jgi:thymidylate synthase (FAD)
MVRKKRKLLMTGSSLDVLDHGHVRLIDVMGDDLRVVDAARVSFNKASAYKHVTWNSWEEAPKHVRNRIGHGLGDWCEGDILSLPDERLIIFLATHNHWSPFSHCQSTFEVKAPMLVKNQWYKHRIGMSYTEDDEIAFENEGWNEMSMRYVSPEDFYIPGVWRSAPDNKKQGSGADLAGSASLIRKLDLEDIVRQGVFLYNLAVEHGVAPEQARLMLPAYAMYTSFYWTVSLFGVIRFLQLRLAPDAQWEIREFSKAVYKLVQPLFPYSFAAFGINDAFAGV